MSVPEPHYLLFSEVDRPYDSGRWGFVLRTVDGSQKLEVTDVEPEARGERLDLLTVVRAFEALDQPSRVSLVGCSPYVRQGMRYGLSEWRSNGWRWEFFGHMVPVKNGDLWQRMDRALQFHRVECRRRPEGRISVSEKDVRNHLCTAPEGPFSQKVPDTFFRGFGIRTAPRRQLSYRMWSILAKCRRRTTAFARLWRRRAIRSQAALAVCARVR